MGNGNIIEENERDDLVKATDEEVQKAIAIFIYLWYNKEKEKEKDTENRRARQ